MPSRLSNTPAWWGAPRKFDNRPEDRRVSWLELFYDLVYVIAIARITHHLSAHFSFEAFLEYISLFLIIFWGWLNGSLYHDIHGNEGLRTRLMTLWQMMIIAALAITINQPTGKSYFSATIVFMIMQLFITYLWWSVGFYDREHRRYNLPYTILFLLSFGLMTLSLFVDESWLKIIVPIVLICNYAPPFISHYLLRRSSLSISLSSSMLERLGLFTIIVFGELVLGVVNGIEATQIQDLTTWIHFALSLAIVFTLWWIFFTLVGNREAKKGFQNATLMELLFIPTLISLGMMAVCFASLFEPHHDAVISVQQLFSYAVATFLAGISLMMGLLIYPTVIDEIKRPARISILVTSGTFLAVGSLNFHLDISYYLIGTLAILLVEITFLNSQYYRLNINAGDLEEE